MRTLKLYIIYFLILIFRTIFMHIIGHRTWIEIDKQALWHNIVQLKACSGSASLGIVLKGNAYGHGMLEIAQLAAAHDAIDWLFVASSLEAIALVECGIKKPILAMSYINSDPHEIITHDIAVVVYDLSMAQALGRAAHALGLRARVHIKVDTNMSRLGVMLQDLPFFIDQISRIAGIYVEGLFTHLSDVNTFDKTFTQEQLRLFNKVVSEHKQIPYCHALGSGALWTTETVQPYDIVRIGTSGYGFWKSDLQKQRYQQLNANMSLKAVLSWKTRIAHVSERSGTELSKIACIPLGYADGYPASLAGKARVQVNGQLIPVLDVGPDMMSLDVSTIHNIVCGDVVTLIGDAEGITATGLAEQVGTINNEIATRIHSAIPRFVVD